MIISVYTCLIKNNNRLINRMLFSLLHFFQSNDDLKHYETELPWWEITSPIQKLLLVIPRHLQCQYQYHLE